MAEFILQYWLAFIFAGISWVIRVYLKKLDAKLDRFLIEQKATKGGVQVILRDRIRQLHSYLMGKGFATVDERDNIFEMYEQYHALGANGVIDKLMDDIANLPVTKRGD